MIDFLMYRKRIDIITQSQKCLLMLLMLQRWLSGAVVA